MILCVSVLIHLCDTAAPVIIVNYIHIPYTYFLRIHLFKDVQHDVSSYTVMLYARLLCSSINWIGSEASIANVAEN